MTRKQNDNLFKTVKNKLQGTLLSVSPNTSISGRLDPSLALRTILSIFHGFPPIHPTCKAMLLFPLHVNTRKKKENLIHSSRKISTQLQL